MSETRTDSVDTLAEENAQHIRDLVRRHEARAIHDAIGNWLPQEVAELFPEFTAAERVLLFRSLPRDRAADVFAYLDYDHQISFLHDLNDQETAHLLEDLSPDDRTALLEELPANVTQQLLRLLKADDLAVARQLLGYPEDSVGRIMTPDYIAIEPEMTVAEAIEHIRKTGHDSETVNVIYVTNKKGVLVDVLRLRRLILARTDARIESLMNSKVIRLSAYDDREKAVEMIRDYDLYALPVTDSQGVLVGIVTVDDLLDVAEEETTEDFQKGAAVSPLDIPYSKASPPLLVRKRIGWLMALIFVNLVSATIIASYEEYLLAFIQLAFFMPLLIASGGNVGAQSATLMVRAIATGDVEPGEWFRAFRKEIVVGIALGIGVGLLTLGLGLFRGGMDIAMVVGLSMVAIVIIANLLGVVMPFILTLLKLDPAAASSPLITSLMDAIGVLVYFAIAAAILTL